MAILFRKKSAAKRICVILAGGQGRRMGGCDKGEKQLAGKRLIDHVVDRLSAQSDRVVISGTHDYARDLPFITDHMNGPRGPVAGLYAALKWASSEPAIEGFYTVPVDGPFLPRDLISRLGANGQSMIAADKTGTHPTFAYWSLVSLRAGFAHLIDQPSTSLHRLADACHAGNVYWDDEGLFLNINRLDELENATRLIGKQQHQANNLASEKNYVN